MPQPPFDLTAAHRWFAIEFNNRAWELAEHRERTGDQEQEMIRTAHASALHWQAIGTPLNAQRAENLLATAYLKIGDGQAALWHAERGLQLGEQNSAAQSTFDRAVTLMVAAQVKNLAGQGNDALELIMQALAAADQLGADDRELFDKLYGQG